MINYHSGNRDHSKHPFRMIANVNIDKLMITFYHCPYTRTNTCTGQRFEYTTPDASRLSLFVVAFLPSELSKTCEG